MNWLRLAIQWSMFNRANTNLNKSTYAARRSFTSHHSYFSLLQPCRKHQKYIAQIMLASYLSMPGVLLAQGVSAAANSVHAPGFDTAANGTPIVNINAPSSKGVSRNEYNELNVETKGLIFNNATDIVNTQLAGFIDGNSRLNGNSANIILNEVKGNSRSALNGYMEIAGRSAELVIANQNGITCNGCGFINTTRGTLTTGLPTFDGAGGLTGFDVSRGDVDISGLGLNASNVDEVDILARSVSLNSKFWAKNAAIVTGQNHINYQDKKVTAALGSSGSGISLDVAAIGGMYANRIRLIGTEKGLGVNVAGEIKAAEDMTLDSQGNLSNSGTISAKTLAVSSKGINNTGNMLGNSISIDAELLDNNTSTANIQAVNSVSIKLKDELINRDGAQILTADGQLIINADAVINKSSMAANQLSIIASQLDNNTENASLYGTDKVSITLSGQLNNQHNALIQSDNQLNVNTDGDFFNNNAAIASMGSTVLNSQNLINNGTIISQNGTFTLTTNKLDNQGRLQGNGVTLIATQLTNSTANGKIYSTGLLDATIDGVMEHAINNKEGALFHADNTLTLTSVNSDIANMASTIESATNTTLNSQNLTNSGTILAQGDTLVVRTQQINNQGLMGGENLDIHASLLNNNTVTSQIYANNNLGLITTGDINNSNGALIHGGDELVLSASGDLTNSNATIESANNSSLTSRNLSNSANSTILAQNGALTINTGTLDNDGTLTGNNIDATATVINNQKSTSNIAATGDLTLKSTQGNINNNNGATISANDTLTISAATDIVNTGSRIESAKNIVLFSRNLTNSDNALIRANDSITVDWTGALSNIDSTFVAKNNIQTTQNTDDLPNKRSGNLINSNSALIHAQDGSLDMTLGNLSNEGSIGANRVELNTTGVSNSGGNALIMANEHLDVRSTGNMDNLDGGSLFSLESGYLQADGTLTNSSATIETRGGDLTINANAIINKRSFVDIKDRSISTNHKEEGEVEVISEGQSERSPKITAQTIVTYVETIVTPFILSTSSVGLIVTGGDLNIEGFIDNLYSTISSSGNINHQGGLNNKPLIATQSVTKKGSLHYTKTKHSYYWENSSGTSSDIRPEEKTEEIKYFNNTTPQSVLLLSPTFTGLKSITGKGGSLNNVGTSETVESLAAKEAGLSPEEFDAARIESRRNAIFDDVFNDFISSALFKASNRPNPNYLIETNPLLTNYKSFISSDYMLNKMTGDEVGRTGKTTSRLGDGYLEQTLVRDQILSFTGFQTLPDSLDIEATYATLMNNAVEEYQDLGLSTGIELSAEQVAQLKKPIVWMVSQTVQTPNGPQDVLVPKVYFSAASGMELRPDGALIAASSIDIETDSDINNTGTMLAKVDLSLKGNNINNSGTLSSSGSASLAASEDIKNTQTIKAAGDLSLVAGGNIINETLTQTRNIALADYSTSETTVDSSASIQGGNVSLSAGNDVRLIGSEVQASGDLALTAGNDVSFEALTMNKSQAVSYGNTSKSTASTTNQVSSLSGNNIQLKAGKTLTSEGAQINASGNLALAANNIDLLAVTDSKDNYSFIGGGGNSTEKRSHNESLTGTTLGAGGTLSLVSQEDIFSKGSTLNGGTGIALAAGGDVILASAEANNTSFEEVKKKTSGFFGSKKSTKTSTSESLTNQGTNLTSGGDIQMVSGSDIVLSGTKATAAGGIDLQAKGDIQLLSAVDQTSSRYQEQKKGTFKVKAKDQGSIKQTAVTSELIANGTSGKGNIVLTSGNNITLEGANLAANDTLFMGAGSDAQESVTKDANGNYVNAAGEQIGNVTVGTQALQSSEWSESSSGFRGILKDLARGVSVVASSMGVKGEIKVGESHATRTDTLKQQTSTLAANDLNIDAQNDVALIGANVAVTDTASINAQNVTIDAAHEQTVVSESHTDHTISSEGATLEEDQISLVSLTETKQTERTTTTANTWAGSNISAGNLSINANKNVAIIASDINVQNDANIKGENILVGGREATTDTTHDSITETKTLTAGVRNAYVDVVLAAQALKDAKDAVSDAKDAYDDAKQKVAEGKLPESDLDLYENKLDSAKKSEKLAVLAVVNAGVTAALSSATAGFTATAGVSTQVTTNTTTATQSNWNGSTINVGNNASLNGQNNLTVEGSAISSQGTLEANAKNIEILAGKNTYTETTSSQTKGASASVTASLGGGVSGSVGVNTSKSNSESQSTQYTNSSLSAGTLVSNSDHLTIKGGNLSGDEVVINTNNLDVVSQQATSTSHSESQGKGINLGGSANSDSMSVSYNQSETDSDYASVTQQSSITAGDKGYKINVAGNTNLVGGLITSTDKAEASGNNAFSTGTLTQKDLANHAVYSGSSMGVDVGISSTTDNDGNSGLGFSNSMGQGSAGDSRQSTTQSGINTANVAITDADKQQQLTGKSVSQTLADAHTTTSTDTADINSGALKNTFNQAEVEQEINNQREVAQAFSKNVQEVKGAITNSINKQKDELNDQLASGKISQTEYDQQNDKLDNYNLLANSISAGLSVPTDSLAGQVAAAASPAVANQIGQYFKGLAADNQDGQLTGGQEVAHDLAHGILAAAVASAGGNDATTAGIAAAGSEAAAPVLAKWLYDKDSSDDLTAAEKQTLTSIMGAASTTVGATTGNVNNAIAAGQAGQNAVENNYLTTLEMGALVNELIGCEGDSDCQKETREKYEEVSDQNVQNMVANCAAGGATSDACLAETKQQGLAITDLQSGKYDAFATGTTEDDILNVFRDINLKDKTLAGELAAGAAVDELAAQYGWSKEQTQAVTMAVVALAAKKGMRNAKGTDANEAPAGSGVNSSAIKKEIDTLKKIGKSQREKFGLQENGGIPDSGIELSNNNAKQLLEKRGATPDQAIDTITSFDGKIKATQGKAGDKFVITEAQTGSGSGRFVTRKSAGSTPEERIENLALPKTNTANVENNVLLGSDQVLLEGKVKGQQGQPWAHENAIGGGQQTVTNGDIIR